jgi:hypothetical protein
MSEEILFITIFLVIIGLFLFLPFYIIWLLVKFEKTRRHKIKLSVVVIIFLLIMKSLCYRTGYDRDPNEQSTQRPRNSWPSANGVVLDAVTKQPIAGAQVRATADFTGFLGSVAAFKGAFTQTDNQGRYKLPAFRYFGYTNSASYHQVIYKAGYVVYDSNWPFKGTLRQKFTFKNNVVLLEKWDDNKYTPHDHVDHVQKIGCASLNPVRDPIWPPGKGIIFCREAREEMILGCLNEFKANPRTEEQCTKYVDESLGLIGK